MKESDVWKEVAECWRFYAETKNHALLYYGNGYPDILTMSGLCRTCACLIDDETLYVVCMDSLRDYIKDNQEEFRDDCGIPLDNTGFLYPPTHEYAKSRYILAVILYERALRKEEKKEL